MDSQLLKTSCQRTTFFQEADTALNHVATTVAASVIVEWSSAPMFATLATRWNDCPNPMSTQPVPNALCVIGFISTDPPWPQTWTPNLAPHLHRLNHLLELGRLVCLSTQ